MSKEVEALETMDEFSDEEYSAYLEYTSLKDQCIANPEVLYIDKDHEFLSEWVYFAQTDGLDIKVGDWETRIC
jgi:hypothetical protein|tara:strand:+ start:477 stop:695 length:219 start_codon:yes stop_codon:yes gene_type:complete